MRMLNVVWIMMGLAILAGPNASAQGNVLSGRVTSISVDDPSHSRGFTRDERRYVVRLQLDSSGNTILGFGENDSSIAPHLGMLQVLLKAMEHDWPVELRLNREVAGSGTKPSHFRVVSVTIKSK